MPKRRRLQTEAIDSTDLRIIGGVFRGSKLTYGAFQRGGSQVTRPMKHRVREAMFNLVSTECKGRHAIDLFAGTGALGLEALSRGAVSATFIEKHIPTARVVQENISALRVDDRCQLLTTSAFLWSKRDLPKTDGKVAKTEGPSYFAPPPLDLPWLVFCSPPYAFYIDRQQETLELIAAVMKYAPEGSIFLVEADERFDFQLLPGQVALERGDPGWDVRTYPPAVVGVLRG